MRKPIFHRIAHVIFYEGYTVYVTSSHGIFLTNNKYSIIFHSSCFQSKILISIYNSLIITEFLLVDNIGGVIGSYYLLIGAPRVCPYERLELVNKRFLRKTTIRSG